MGLDILLFRADNADGQGPESVRDSQRRRFAPVELVDEVIRLDQEWRTARFNLDQANKELGRLKKSIGEMQIAKKKGKAVSAEDEQAALAKKVALEASLEGLEHKEEEAKNAVDAKLPHIGNIVHPSVPVSADEKDNLVYKTWGEPVPLEGGHYHSELLAMIDGYDQERGTKVGGHRAYFLKGWGVKLNLALINYGITFLESKGYTPMHTPFFMKKTVMALTAQLSEFDDQLYKVGEGTVKDPDDYDEKYLIATSEQPLSGFHLGEWMVPSSLPLKYCGYSTNFRKEAGAHGRDTWGIFRVHQFEKIEQFVLSKPSESWAVHEEMLATAEEFYQSLGFSYRVVSIVSGALNNAAAKKYDLEAWFPKFREFKELVSCSNCTDYQARSLEVRCGMKKEGVKKKEYVHMLNSTLCATERTLCCLLENCQTPQGIRVPAPLRPFLGGVEIIPYTKPCPKRPSTVPAPTAAATTTTTSSATASTTTTATPASTPVTTPAVTPATTPAVTPAAETPAKPTTGGSS
ncbi:seryl-tRNA synthetase [Pelomyxa schiedti]|nr:seryl-tRNA synthetase [Pelomyxa schiedti]